MSAIRLFQVSNTGKSSKITKVLKVNRKFRQDQRKFTTGNVRNQNGINKWYALLASVGLATSLAVFSEREKYAFAAEVDYEAVRNSIKALLENENYDDGSYGPVFVRLAWHSSGTYDKKSQTGGSSKGSMRFSPESNHGANAGLDVARELLEPLIAQYPGLSYGDLYTLAGVVAVEQLGGPKIQWYPGRKDGTAKDCTPDGRLPDADKKQDHVRDIFYRMGFNDQEIVALIGAHALGRCHTDRSGYDGPWTASPTVFSNDFYVQLLDRTWTERKWNGPLQYEDENKEIMMTPADLSFIEDPKFLIWVKTYADDEDIFFRDFAAAYSKLLHLGFRK